MPAMPGGFYLIFEVKVNILEFRLGSICLSVIRIAACRI